MKKLRILALTHESLVPPETLDGLTHQEILPFKTEVEVIDTLLELGHEVRVLGIQYEITPLRDLVDEWKPDIVFNLLEEFKDLRQNDAHVVAYLELLGVPYTGCGPRGLFLARDKALSKKILNFHRLPVPRFHSFAMGRKVKRPARLEFPLIVKPLFEEGSTGISKASLVDSDQKLVERVEFVHQRFKTDAIVEQFIPGREVYSAVLGNKRLQVLPTWEIKFEKKPEDQPLINTAHAKWNLEYQEKMGITLGPAKLKPELEAKVGRLARRIFRRLDLSGYARMDFRLSPEGTPYFLEANPNPDLGMGEELAEAAQAAGLKYGALLERLIRLGLNRPERS